MKTLLLAIGIIIAFGSLFLIDRYNTGPKDGDQEDAGDEENEEGSEL